MDNYGLVLCGGGGRGSYQIGVWKAMNELGYTQKITAVSGTSVGSLNGALFVSKTVEQAEEIWCSISTSDLMDISEHSGFLVDTASSIFNGTFTISKPLNYISEYLQKEKGLFSRNGLRRIIEDNNICRSVMKSDIPVFACYKNAEDAMINRKVVFKDMRECSDENEVIDILFASSCLPFIFKTVNGIDGGFLGVNTPVEPLYSMGLRKFIVIGLDPEKDFRGNEYYSDAEFIYIKPSKSIYLGQSGRTIINDGLIDFNGEHARERIQIGYQEGISQLMGNKSLIDHARQGYFLP